MKKKRLMIYFLVLFSLFLQTLISNSTITSDTCALVVNDYMNIHSDDDFITMGFPGSGTESDPYVIENYKIHSSDPTCEGIHVKNTTKYFVIQECEISNSFYAIFVEDVAPGTGQVLNNYCYSNKHDGMGIENSNDLIISGNIIEGSYCVGLTIMNCSDLLISNNKISSSGRSGLAIYSSSNLNITENISKENKYNGIVMRVTINCILYKNLFESNEEYGVEIDVYCSENIFHHNDFIDNNLEVATSQAKDGGINEIWYDSTMLEGNYWNDHSGSGEYSLDGVGGCCDKYPLEKPYNTATTAFHYYLFILTFIPITYIIQRKRKR